MRNRTFALMCALVLGLACLPAATLAQDDQAEPTPTPTPPPPLLEQRGVVVTEQQALERIAFRPFVPVPRPLEVALIAPFHNSPGGEDPRSYGVGYEYLSHGRHYVLREWPIRNSGGLAQYQPLTGNAECKDSYLLIGSVSNVGGIGWETKRLVFALQPDDGLHPVRDRGAALKAEWHRLAARGACR